VKYLDRDGGIGILKLHRREKETKQKIVKILKGRVGNKIFKVDYTNKRFYEVCKDFIDFIDFTIKSSKSPDMLCRPWAPDTQDLPLKDTDSLPSWICRLPRSRFRPRPEGNFGRVDDDLLVGMTDSRGRLTMHRQLQE
jgi:hypothetical protein